MKLSAGTALALMLGAGLVMASTPARAADDDVPIDKKILRSILEGIGLQRDGQATINYQERPPLVIPPNNDLPPPEKSDALIATNPNWPKDPDILRRKEEEQRDRNRNISEEREHEKNPLRPDELTPGKPPKYTARDDGYEAPASGFANPLSPSELGYKGGLLGSMFGKKDDSEAVHFTGEKPRASLTEPPAGYQTPSPDQPYGSAKAPPPKADNYMESHPELHE